MSREEHHEEELEEEEPEQLPCSHPRIYEGEWHQSMPVGFDAVTIDLDGCMQADLNWKKAKAQALQAIEKGYALMWNMQMGLFDKLIHPLTHQAQFLSLTLALEHFRDSLWKEFKAHTLGISLFRGSADFSQGFHWDEHQEQSLRSWLQDIHVPQLAALDLAQIKEHEEAVPLIRLYCRDVAIEYLALLATRLPDSLQTYLFLDAHFLPRSLLTEIQILNPERFDRLHLALQGHQLPFHALGWKTPTAQGYSGHSLVGLPATKEVAVGVCIPPMHFYHSLYYKGIEGALLALQQKSIPFKLIAESHLTAQWDGLDYLLFSPSGLTVQGKRKLQGFCAAGGTAVSTSHLIGLPDEISVEDWLNLSS